MGDGAGTTATSNIGTLLAPLASGEGVIFLILSLGIVAMSIVCMTRRNPVSAVMSLVATFFGLAGLYAMLSAHFLAVLQVIVYAGAIMVLFIFVVMIVNREETTLISLRGLPSRVLGVLAGVYLMWVFAGIVIPDQSAGAAGGVPPLAVLPETFGTVASIGDVLFRQFLFPFEAISVLLLVAIVGGVVVSRSARKESDAVLAADKRIAVAELSGHDSPVQLEGVGDNAHGAGGGHH
ncbi:MAG: NADH-quinone oxidoreductase subunit J [Deltaproteobacteria bacterium]|nr:NADH-quinone oxidoreductase subunit J [Deltaproteobacteria bacterium]